MVSVVPVMAEIEVLASGKGEVGQWQWQGGQWQWWRDPGVVVELMAVVEGPGVVVELMALSSMWQGWCWYWHHIVDGTGSKWRYGTTDAKGVTGNSGNIRGSGLATVVVALLTQHP